MAVYTSSVSQNIDSLVSRQNYDSLQIINGATVTVNTNQSRSFRIIDIQNGTLRIENTSSTVPIRFLMGRGAGATSNTITTATGLASIVISGSWIEMGIGGGIMTQSFNSPYTDFIPAIWVETTSGSNQFEPWLNLTTTVGESLQYFYEDLSFAYNGNRGKFFKQATIAEPYPITYTGSLSGSGFINSGVSLLYTSSISCGDGAYNGNVFPSGSRIRIPNIMITDVTPLNLLTATSATQANFVLSKGVFDCNTALFDESFGNFAEAQTVTMKNCAWAEYPTISECYSLTINNVGFSSHPIRRYFVAATGWTTRDLRWGGTPAAPIWSYINGANINTLYIGNFGYTSLTAAVPAISSFAGNLYINNSTDLIINNLKCFQYFAGKNFQHGLVLNFVNDSTFTNTELYGGDFFNIQNCLNNTFTATTASQGWAGETRGFTSTWKRGIDPTTNDTFKLGTPYFLKFRTYRNSQPQSYLNSYTTQSYFFNTGSEYVDSRVQSFTPYTASGLDAINHPDYFGVAVTHSLTGRPSASLTWVRRDPTVVYEIFRGTGSNFVLETANRIYSSSTVATVTLIDTGSLSVPAFSFTSSIGNTFYYVLRKHSTSSTTGSAYSDSAEQIFIPQTPPTASNLALQSSVFDNAGWVKVGVTATAAQRQATNDAPIGAAAVLSGDALRFTAITGQCTQSLSVTSGSQYIFSMYVSSLTSSVSFSLSASHFGNHKTQNFVATQKWQRYSIEFNPNITTTTASIGIHGNSIIPINTTLWVAHAQVNTGSVAQPHISTTTAAAIQQVASEEPTSIRYWSIGTNSSGVEIQFPTLLTGMLYWQLFCSTSSNFVSDKSNLIADSVARGGGQPIYMSNSANNVFDGFLLPNKNSGVGTVFLTLINATSENRFLNFDLDYNYTATNLMNVSVLSNNNFFHNWKIGKYRNSVATNYLISPVNNTSGITIQNMYAEVTDIPLNNLALNTILKNVSCANTRPVAASVVATLGSTSHGTLIAGNSIFDTIFSEFNWGKNTGSLHLTFNASSKTNLPYEIVGSTYFSNTGRLYFLETGSSITYTWPHKIYGVTGFLPVMVMPGNFKTKTPFCNSVDLGTQTTSSFGLLKHISVDTGSGYGDWIEIGPSLSSSIFDPIEGVNVKIRLSAPPAIKYDGQTNNFVSGSRIYGQTSTAEAIVQADEDLGTTGTLILQQITGSFVNNENIRSAAGGGGIVYALVNAVASSPRAILPIPTSYIDGLQIFTTIDSSSLYPIRQPSITLTGVISGSKVDLIKQSDSSIIDAQFVSTDPTGSYSYTYDYYENTPIYIVINNLGYVFQRTSYTLTESDVSIPIEQQIDRNYSNPP